MCRNSLFPLSVFLITLFTTVAVGNEKIASEALEDSIFVMAKILEDSNEILSDTEKTIKKNDKVVNKFLVNMKNANSQLQEVEVKSNKKLTTKNLKRALKSLEKASDHLDRIERDLTEFEDYIIGEVFKLEKNLKVITLAREKIEKELNSEEGEAIKKIIEKQLYLTIVTQDLILAKIQLLNEAGKNPASVKEDISEALSTIEPHKQTAKQLVNLIDSKDQAKFSNQDINLIYYLESFLEDIDLPPNIPPVKSRKY